MATSKRLSGDSQNENWWYIINKEKYNVDVGRAKLKNIKLESCVKCEFGILSTSYQQNHCGSRYCRECFVELTDNYLCDICKFDDPDNVVHRKETMFLDKAMDKDLAKAEVNCPDCQMPVNLKSLLNHLPKCSNAWSLCVTCNTMKKGLNHKCNPKIIAARKREEIDLMCDRCGKQLRTLMDHECPINWKKACPYNCNVAAGELNQHREDCHLKHLNILMGIMKQNNLDAIVDKDKPGDKTYETLCQGLVDQVQKHLKINENLPNLQKSMMRLKKELESEKEQYEKVRRNVEDQVKEVYNTSFDGTILWCLDKWSNTLRDTISDDQPISIFSSPFYSSRFGYKMCLRLYPNGDNRAKGQAMSLFLVIMKGQYDNVMQWPFKQKVTFILLDQGFKSDYIDAFVPTDNVDSFTQPRTDMNTPAGSSFFIKNEDMRNFTYVKNDCIFIRCIVDCSDLPD